MLQIARICYKQKNDSMKMVPAAIFWYEWIFRNASTEILQHNSYAAGNLFM